MSIWSSLKLALTVTDDRNQYTGADCGTSIDVGVATSGLSDVVRFSLTSMPDYGKHLDVCLYLRPDEVRQLVDALAEALRITGPAEGA